MDTGHWIQQNIICVDLGGFRLLSSKCCWSELSFVKCHSGRSWSPRHPLSNVLSAVEKKSPFSNIFWKINVARESPQDRKNILYGSTIALNCILERLLSRENCFLVRHLNRKLKTPGALLRRTNIKFHIQTAAVCEHWALHCCREDLQNPGAWELMERPRSLTVDCFLLKFKTKVLHAWLFWMEWGHEIWAKYLLYRLFELLLQLKSWCT